MHKIILFSLFILLSKNVYGEMIKPDPSIGPKEVISIQLKALQKNNLPFDDAGIEQTWEFAHPNNKRFTGPLTNFKEMIKGQSYNMLLNHRKHKIKKLFSDKNIAVFNVTVLDNSKRYYKFTWHVEKYLGEGPLKNCWLTTIVSEPIPLGSSI